MKNKEDDEFAALRLTALQVWNDVCKLRREHVDIRQKIRDLRSKDRDVCMSITDNENRFQALSMKAFGIENK